MSIGPQLVMSLTVYRPGGSVAVGAVRCGCGRGAGAVAGVQPLGY